MTRWTIDPAHSEVTFKVKHLVISTVTGHFSGYRATIEASEPDFSDAQVTFAADVDTIQTKNEQRDAHLKSPDFFDAANFPTIAFTSTKVKKTADDTLEVRGDLTMRGVTKEVVLEAAYNGTVAGFGGAPVAGFEIRGKVNRFDFGLQWNALTEAGGVVVASDVRLEILAEFHQVLEAAKAA
jgi:polyisoprenoid-binding protein YceI